MPFDSSMDRIHAPGPEENWQESDCYWFYDNAAGIGGFHRIGQKPNQKTGQLTLFIFDRNRQRYVLNDSYTNDRAVSPEDRWENGHRIGSHKAESLGDQKMRYSWDDVDTAADLEFYEGFYSPRSWTKERASSDFETTEDFMKNFNPGGHLECSGRIRGSVRIGMNTVKIDGFAHRDRSWGHRHEGPISYHKFRMCSGTVGPDLSFACFVLNRRDGSDGVAGTTAGFVVRKGVEHDVTDLRVINLFDADGLTVMGGTAVLTLENGEKLKLELAPAQAMLTYLPGAKAFVSDNIMEVTYQGKKGFCDLEVTINPGRGEYMVRQEDVPTLGVDLGLSDSRSYEY